MISDMLFMLCYVAPFGESRLETGMMYFLSLSDFFDGEQTEGNMLFFDYSLQITVQLFCNHGATYK